MIFHVEGHNIKTLVIDDNSLRFAGKIFNFGEEFDVFWEKKLTTITKVEIKYNQIKNATKELSSKKVVIWYKMFGIIPMNCEFEFAAPHDHELLFDHLKERQFFQVFEEHQISLNAILEYLFGLILTIFVTAVSYCIATGIFSDSGSDHKAKIFTYLTQKLGGKGILAIGGIISAFILYKIVARYKNPPNRIKAIPPLA